VEPSRGIAFAPANTLGFVRATLVIEEDREVFANDLGVGVVRSQGAIENVQSLSVARLRFGMAPLGV
jgi:hypothetical protein